MESTTTSPKPSAAKPSTSAAPKPRKYPTGKTARDFDFVCVHSPHAKKLVLGKGHLDHPIKIVLGYNSVKRHRWELVKDEAARRYGSTLEVTDPQK